MKLNFFKKSKIAQRISKKISIIYIAIYFFILLLLLLILTPTLYKNAVKKAGNNLSAMTDEYLISQNTMAEYTNYFYLYTNVEASLKTYYNQPNSSNASKVNLYLSSIVSNSGNILSITLEDSGGSFFSSTSYQDIDKKSLLHSYTKYKELLSHEYGSYYLPLIKDFSSSEYLTYQCFAFAKNLPIGHFPLTVTIFYNASSMLKHCNELSDATFSSFAIIDRYQNYLYQSDVSNFYDDFLDDIYNYTTTIDYFKIDNGVLFYETIPSTSCTLIAYAPYHQLLSDAIFIIGVITILYLISPILYVAFLLPITGKQLAPLKLLSDSMENYTVGSSQQLTILTGDEIEIVSNSYNKMIDEINHQIKKIKASEHENSVVSYKLLATQIDPHFIYNTMNIINIMAREGKTDAVIEINTALIKILRERLNSNITVYDTIQNEISTLMQYSLIMNYRYQDHISIRFDVDDALQNKKIPKNILQPLVENAFFHGFSNEFDISKGKVEVLIYSINKDIIIEVNDNGKGMTQERIEKILNHSYSIYSDQKPHIGINNIKQRLDYLYQGNYQLDIQSTLNEGTTIIITIPMLIKYAIEDNSTH